MQELCVQELCVQELCAQELCRARLTRSSLIPCSHLYTLDDTLQPAAHWGLELQEVKGEMEATIGMKSTIHCRHH